MPAAAPVLLVALLTASLGLSSSNDVSESGGASAAPAAEQPLAPGPRTLAPRSVRPRGAWQWPLDPPPEVVRRFEAPPQPWASGHRGVDLLGHGGQQVLAAGNGTVTFSGVVAGRGVVTVRHAGGWRTTYEPVTDGLPRGTSVARGDLLGELEPAGSHCAPRVCLHWGALTGPRQYRDPLALLGLVQPVLLPDRDSRSRLRAG